MLRREREGFIGVVAFEIYLNVIMKVAEFADCDSHVHARTMSKSHYIGNLGL